MGFFVDATGAHVVASSGSANTSPHSRATPPLLAVVAATLGAGVGSEMFIACSATDRPRASPIATLLASSPTYSPTSATVLLPSSVLCPGTAQWIGSLALQTKEPPQHSEQHAQDESDEPLVLRYALVHLLVHPNQDRVLQYPRQRRSLIASIGSSITAAAPVATAATALVATTAATTTAPKLIRIAMTSLTTVKLALVLRSSDHTADTCRNQVDRYPYSRAWDTWQACLLVRPSRA